MLPSKFNEREKEIADSEIKKYILDVLKEDMDLDDSEYKAMLEILRNVDKKSR